MWIGMGGVEGGSARLMRTWIWSVSGECGEGSQALLVDVAVGDEAEAEGEGLEVGGGSGGGRRGRGAVIGFIGGMSETCEEQGDAREPLRRRERGVAGSWEGLREEGQGIFPMKREDSPYFREGRQGRDCSEIVEQIAMHNG